MTSEEKIAAAREEHKLPVQDSTVDPVIDNIINPVVNKTTTTDTPIFSDTKIVDSH